MDSKKKLQGSDDQNIFIKAVKKPAIDTSQKAALNRKGNMLYNSGDVEGAKKIFLATGYSDGLTRVGDYYKSKGRNMDALRMYWLAPDHKKSDAIIMQLSGLIRDLIREEGERPNDV